MQPLLQANARNVAPADDSPHDAAIVPVLMRLLDEIDYGLVLLDAAGTLRCTNRRALQSFAELGPLRLAQGRVMARHAADQQALERAIEQARCNRRTFVALRRGASRATVAIVPIERPGAARSEPLSILLVLQRERVCEPLTLDYFARAHRLTLAERNVLDGLCAGQRPAQTALRLGVALSTVRTQISNIRAKTDADSIAGLLSRLAALPPMVCMLHSAEPVQLDT